MRQQKTGILNKIFPVLQVHQMSQYRNEAKLGAERRAVQHQVQEIPPREGQRGGGAGDRGGGAVSENRAHRDSGKK